MTRGMWVAGALGALIVVGGTALVAVVQQDTVNDRFEGFRERVMVPDGWTRAEEDVRYAGLFGTCMITGFDVRECPSSSDTYEIDLVDYPLPEDLSGWYFEKTGYEVVDEDCGPRPENAFGQVTLCRIELERGDHVVVFSVVGDVDEVDGVSAVTSAKGYVAIDR